MTKTCLGFGDLALIFKVTVEPNGSNLKQTEHVCKIQGRGTSVFSENNTRVVVGGGSNYKLIIFFLNQNICCGYSKELSL